MCCQWILQNTDKCCYRHRLHCYMVDHTPLQHINAMVGKVLLQYLQLTCSRQLSNLFKLLISSESGHTQLHSPSSCYIIETERVILTYISGFCLEFWTSKHKIMQRLVIWTVECGPSLSIIVWKEAVGFIVNYPCTKPEMWPECNYFRNNNYFLHVTPKFSWICCKVEFIGKLWFSSLGIKSSDLSPLKLPIKPSVLFVKLLGKLTINTDNSIFLCYFYSYSTGEWPISVTTF